MMLTQNERELLEVAWDDWCGLCEIYPQITINHPDGRSIRILDPASTLRGLIQKGLVRLCYYLPAKREYRQVETGAHGLLEDPENWKGSEDRERAQLGFVITERGEDEMQAIWAEENKR